MKSFLFALSAAVIFVPSQAKAQFQTYQDPVLEMGAAFVFLQKEINNLNSHINDLNLTITDECLMPGQPEYDYFQALISVAKADSQTLADAQTLVQSAYSAFQRGEADHALQALAGALTGTRTSAGLLTLTDLLDFGALSEAYLDGSGLMGAPGNSSQVVWLAMWATFYAFLDIADLAVPATSSDQGNGG